MRAPNEAVTALLRLDSLSSSPYLVVGMSCCCCGQLLADLYILGCRCRLTMPARLPAWHLAIWLAGCTSFVIESPVIPATTTPPKDPKLQVCAATKLGGLQALPLLGRPAAGKQTLKDEGRCPFCPFIIPHSTQSTRHSTAQAGHVAVLARCVDEPLARFNMARNTSVPSPTYMRSNYRQVQASGNPSRSKSNIANA